ncbi:hypothetical protein V2J09_015916 [Rumex salicifolius]
MNSLSLVTSLGFLSNRQRCPSDIHLQPSPSFHARFHCLSIQIHSRRSLGLPVSSAVPMDEGIVSVMNFEELMEKNWTFLEPENAISKEHHDRMTNQVITAGKIGDESRILVSIGSDDFVDRLADNLANRFLLVVHHSLLMLAGIVERYDTVKCWMGELIYVPEKWAPFDVVFLYCLPALPFKLDDIFRVLASRCAPGARIVISHVEGRQGLEHQKQRYGDMIVADLPDKTTLEKIAADHSFGIVEFIDDPKFYLAVLEMKG